MKKSYFGPGLFSFLRELKKNNNRDWFAEHKKRYEEQAKEPMNRFIADFEPVLAKISKNFRGSQFRIYRDTRFAKDKSPYKTHVAAHFRHRATQNDVHAPGFYLHIEPGSVWMGAGLWHPDGPSLKKVRDAMVAKPAVWKKATTKLELHGDALKRPPRGYDPEHELAADLKRTDFVCMSELSEKVALAPDFLDRFAATCKQAAPLCRFLTTSLKLPF
jgi:uncharacterized protein (TIGR02453 family)